MMGVLTHRLSLSVRLSFIIIGIVIIQKLMYQHFLQPMLSCSIIDLRVLDPPLQFIWPLMEFSPHFSDEEGK